MLINHFSVLLASVKRAFYFILFSYIIYLTILFLTPASCNGSAPGGPGGRHLGDDAAELRAVLRERQQVADGAADGVDVVRRLDLFDQDLSGKRG